VVCTKVLVTSVNYSVNKIVLIKGLIIVFLFSTSLKLQRFGRKVLILSVLSFFDCSAVGDRVLFCDRLNS
ncbi:hypothetical protein, partial [Bartonella sp. TT110JLCBS]|uniref:hypothetical protein n=1 Tax=Bartonella sp. TT110JLCBS TaxID=3243578 RepID=UPI0035D0BE54